MVKSASNTDEEMELIQSAGEQVVSHEKGKVAWALLITVAFVGIFSFHGWKHPTKVDVAEVVGLQSGWNGYLDHLIKKCEGQCDLGVIIGLNNGEQWTDASSPQHLGISAPEAAALARAFRNEDFSSLQANGILVAGVKYFYLKQLKDDGSHTMILGKKKDEGGITLAATKTGIVIAHTAEGSEQGKTNEAVKQLADYIRSMNMRRLTDYTNARRLQEDEAAVVIDLESKAYRAGFGGDDEPKVNLPTEGDDKSRLEEAYAKLEADASAQSVLIIEAPLSPPEQRQALTQTLFDDFKVPKMYLANRAVMAAYAAGRTTAMVLLIDSDAAYAVPIYESHAVAHGTIRVELSDGVPQFEDAGVSNFGELVFNSIMKCDVDFRKDLFANTIIAGNAEKDQVEQDLTSLAPSTMKIKVRSVGKDTSSAWIGGSIMSSLSTFISQAFTSEEYSKYGPSAVQYKCF